MIKYTYILSILILLGCNTEERVGNTKELAQEMKAMQIKRVTDAQLVATVDEWGKQMASVAQKALEKEMAQNPAQAGTLCQNPASLPLIAALDKEYGVTIQLMGPEDVQNPALSAKERELLDAYLYNAENNLPQSDNVQKLNDTLLVYNAPVPAGSQISAECFKNQKVSFAVWRILFDKKMVIRKLDAKKLNK
ncbi:MAG: hypothetical protein KKG00_13235 [Bacteroidetes bacterium]|nr:hypothetical protein [Bacteroidota bacterium]